MRLLLVILVSFLILILIVGCNNEFEEHRISVIMTWSEKEILQAAAELAEGKDFAIIARKYSKHLSSQEGGDIGFVEIEGLRVELREQIRELSVGQTSQIIRAGNEYYILLITDHQIVVEPIISPEQVLQIFFGSVVCLAIIILYTGYKNYITQRQTILPIPGGEQITIYGSLNQPDKINSSEQDKFLRLVSFEYCISLTIITFTRPSKFFVLREGDSWFARAVPYIFVSLLFGWWGFPFGPIYTVQTIIKNLKGGNRFRLSVQDGELTLTEETAWN